jgi:hypothetical protein
VSGSTCASGRGSFLLVTSRTKQILDAKVYSLILMLRWVFFESFFFSGLSSRYQLAT